MINGGYAETPDNWIERLDDGDVEEPELEESEIEPKMTLEETIDWLNRQWSMNDIH